MRRLLIVCALVAGCAGGGSDSEPGAPYGEVFVGSTCAAPSGVWKVDAAPAVGARDDCSSLTPTTLDFSPTQKFQGRPCTMTGTATQDGPETCGYAYVLECSGDIPSAVFRWTIMVDRSTPHPDWIVGTIKGEDLIGGKQDCQSLWSVSIKP